MDILSREKLKTLTILYVEDEVRIRERISQSLRYYVKEVFEAGDGVRALQIYQEKKPDIVFTDIMMPEMDGIALAKQIRKSDTKTPIVMVTAHTDKAYLLSAVELHLEQYIVKPINLRELKKSLEKCLASISENHALSESLDEEYRYDLDKKILLHKGKIIKLSKKEILFLELLMQHRHRVVTYEELQNEVWQDDVMTDAALKSLIRNIRHKLPKSYIKNLSGVGYTLRA